MSVATEENKGYRVIDRRGGQKAWGGSVYATPRNTNQSNFFGPLEYLDLKEAVQQWDWLDMLNYSRQLVARRGNLGWAVWQKNRYAVGNAWKAQFRGKNKKWGAAAEEWLAEQWYPNCDIRGGIFSFQKNLGLSGMAWDVDGDDLMVMAVREDGWPVLKFYSSHEIGSAGDNEVKGGAFDGAKLKNGIIVGRNKEFLGVRIVGQDGKYEDIAAYNCQLCFEPDWRNVDRGVPRVGKAVMDWLNAEETDRFISRGVKLDASIGLLHWTEEGGAPTSQDILSGRGTGTSGNDGVEASDVKFEKRLGGEVYYMRAGRGEKIEAFKGDRPSPETEVFVARLERRGLLAIGWFYELMDPSEIGGASVRAIQDQARHSICDRQINLGPRAKRGVHFALMQAQQIGSIPKNPDPDDQFRWDFELPALLTVDQGNEEDADRENYKLGTTTLSALTQKKGKWWEDTRDQKTVEAKNLIDKAVELIAYASTQKQTLSFREAIEMIQQSSPNPVAQSNAERGTGNAEQKAGK